MQAIHAANNLNIEFGVDIWRLVNTELDIPTVLVEATPEGLITHPVFRAARSLPSSTVAPAQIMRIMLGWAPENQAWRLGMLLLDGGVTKFDTTQMQWCELAAWPNEVYSDQIESAKLAGQSLARLINRPFQYLEPHEETRVAIFTAPPSEDEVDAESSELSPEVIAEEAPILPEIQPLTLPHRFTGWRLSRIATGVRWRRVRSWWVTNVGRFVILSILCTLFFVLGIGSRTRGLAKVDPTNLPDIGLAIGALLLFGLMHNIWQLLSASGVVIDTFHREIYAQGLVFPFIHWRISFDMIQYLLITQSPPRALGRRRHNDPMRIAQEVWLHIYDGNEFHEIVELGNVEGRSWAWETVRTQSHSRVRRNFQLTQYDTPAHQAAQMIAELVGVPVYLDLV